jgi:phosphate transport system substrate-binding protein
VQIDGGKGCVTPSADAVQSGTYAPLGRPLYVYVSNTAAKRAEVKAFATFYVDNEPKITEEALFVKLNADQQSKAKAAVAAMG